MGWGKRRWRQRLFEWEEELVSKCLVCLANVILHDNVFYSWSLIYRYGGDYSPKETYRLLRYDVNFASRKII